MENSDFFKFISENSENFLDNMIKTLHREKSKPKLPTLKEGKIDTQARARLEYPLYKFVEYYLYM